MVVVAGQGEKRSSPKRELHVCMYVSGVASYLASKLTAGGLLLALGYDIIFWSVNDGEREPTKE